MSISAAVLLLNAVSGATAGDITPISLAAAPRVVDLGDASYDWNSQQRGLKLADNTATCDPSLAEPETARIRCPTAGSIEPGSRVDR